MGKLITIGQTLLDGLKWLMEGNNWLLLTPVLLISAYVMFRMVKRKETFLIFIWYLATISILSVMLELALGTWEALTVALIFILLYLVVYIPHLSKRFHVGKQGRHAARTGRSRQK